MKTINEVRQELEHVPVLEQADSPAPPNSDDNPMLTIIQELVDDVALALESKLGTIAKIRAAGGPYVDSLVIQQSRLLHEAAALAIATVINNPKLKPPAPN